MTLARGLIAANAADWLAWGRCYVSLLLTRTRPGADVVIPSRCGRRAASGENGCSARGTRTGMLSSVSTMANISASIARACSIPQPTWVRSGANLLKSPHYGVSPGTLPHTSPVRCQRTCGISGPQPRRSSESATMAGAMVRSHASAAATVRGSRAELAARRHVLPYPDAPTLSCISKSACS